MKNLVKFFIENYKLTIVLSFFVIIFGVLGLKKLRAESFPAVNFAMAIITTYYDGATPEDIETKITKEIEDEIQTVSGLKDVRSTSQANMSRIFVRIDMDNEDEKEVMTELEKAVDRVTDLPADIREDPDFLEIKSDEFPAIEIAVVGENKKRKRDIVADLLKEEIEDNKKVLNVRPVGYQEREFSIKLDRKKLDDFHIGVDEILSKIGSRNVNIPGGDLEKDRFQELVRIEGKVQSVAELKNIVIRANFSGQKVLLQDVAEVVDGYKEENILPSIDGKEATLLVVSKKGGSDTIELVEEVSKVLERFKKQYQDEFEFIIYNNEGLKVENRLSILSGNAISGLVLVIIFLLIFLPGRIGIVASLSLPLAVLATLGLMPIFEMNLDAITILALVIALGMLVDNSVVISENFTRLKHQGMSGVKAAQESVSQLWLPITATAFTTIAAFLPMLVTKGIMGEFIRFIPIIVTISLLISLGESFFFLPMRLSLATKGQSIEQSSESDQDANSSEHGHQDWFHRFIMKFESLMTWAIKYRYIVFLFFGVIIFGSFLLMTLGNKFILFPAEQTELYIGRFKAPKGTRVEVTREYSQKLSQRVREVMGEDVKFVVARAGRDKVQENDPKGGTGNNLGMLLIYASENAKYNVKHTDFLRRLRSIKPDYVEEISFEEQINGPPVGAPINATFRSNKVESINSVVAEITRELKDVSGIFDLKVNDVIGDDEIYINVDYTKADRLGLSVNDVGETVRTALSGNVVSKVVLDNKEVELKVRFLPEYRDSIKALKKITIMDRMGNLVPLDKIASFKKTSGTPQIKHFDFKRSKTLTGNIHEEQITSGQANKKLRDIFNRLQSSYPDVSLVFGGQEESTKESFESLLEALVLALVGIFALMVFLFKSYLRPFIIMTTIPLGLVGFSIAFFFHQKPISFLAMIGVIGLAGIIVNSGIVLISFIDQLKEEGKLSLHDILVRASGLRLRAVVVTSATTVSGLLPTAYGIGGSDAMLVPMTMAMAWGLTSGTLLTLIWVPCAYAILEDWNNFIGKLYSKAKNLKTSTDEQIRV